ncbi:MAG: sulfotransferase [Hellea sp.]
MLENSTKDLVFIVSGGRTGTTFFGDYLSDVVEDCYSEHEPDLLVGFQAKTRKRIKRFGIYHMVIGRLLRQTGIRNLAQKYLSGELSDSQIIDKIYKHRRRYHGSIEASLIVESYYVWYGLLGPLRKSYPDAKILAIIRDPRDWVRSWMNYGGFYGKSDQIKWFGQSRVTPAVIGDTIQAQKWAEMTHFEKICWNWNLTYGLISNFVESDDHGRVFRFEDIFLTGADENSLEKLMDFTTRFEHRQYSYDLEKLKTKPSANSSKKTLPSWLDWTPEQARQMDRLCGDLMRANNYGLETEWLNKLNQ